MTTLLMMQYWKIFWSGWPITELLQQRQKWRRLGLTQGRQNYPKKAELSRRRKTWGLTVEIPLDKVAVGNLTKLLDAKGNLIRKALGITDLRIEVLDDRVAFPWFSQVDADSAAAYTHFISALCEMSKNAKRVTATEKPVDNEKYAFRCFLLRLGFIGAEYKMERKILLKNLSGNSAFKTKVDVLQPEPVPSAMYVAADENPDLTEALLDEILIQQVNREMGDDRNEISE